MKSDELIYRTLLEHAADGVVIVDQDGRIVLANGKAEELFGYRRDELLGQQVEILLPERLHEVHREHRVQYLADPRNRPMGGELDLVARRKDGSEFPVAISLSFAGDEDGMRVMASVSDITEFKQAQQEKARHMEERISQLEDELHSLERMASNPATATTAASFGAGALRESSPDIFEACVAQFGEVMDLALERDSYKVEHNLAEKLRTMAEKLGFLKGGPRDVIEIYSTALRLRTVNVLNAKAQVYVDEGRLIALEMMGYLVSFYRNYAGMGSKETFPDEAHRPGRGGEHE